ncbi:sigma-70 family RNA polymerase sigma factor [Synechococcus sp. CCY 9618]|uniref:sigma-70 family RNA polymerase sigma factor n=1 Tax=Synechococcus sp. CCY 9618 TaxID=2815602 RepID=UPI0020B26070|nr:sigma-70 family RNA polymerase sigma factor [Synechococcus sp. CCY 9618]
MALNPSDADAPPSRSRPRGPLDDRGAATGNLAELYDSCGGPVYRLALRLCRSTHEAEDLTHDVFLRFWQQGRYDPDRGPVLAYLLLLTRSMALNRIQQRANRWQLVQRWSEHLFPAAVPTPHDSAEAEDLAERVRSALAAIPASQRQVLEMAYYEGLSQSAIGALLELPLGTVKTRARQGLIRLRALLHDSCAQP